MVCTRREGGSDFCRPGFENGKIGNLHDTGFIIGEESLAVGKEGLALVCSGKSVGRIEAINVGEERIGVGMPVRIVGVQDGKVLVEGVEGDSERILKIVARE